MNKKPRVMNPHMKFIANVVLTNAVEQKETPEEIVWSRLGVFEKVRKSLETTKLLVEGNLPLKNRGKTYFLEEIRSQGVKQLSALCFETGIHYLPSRFGKKRRDGIRITNSRLLITPHSLERLHQRSGYREITSEMIFTQIDNEWVEFLSRFASRYRRGRKSSKYWLVPFAGGAFLVRPHKEDNFGSIQTFRPKHKKIDEQLETKNTHPYSLHAVTFIDGWDMYEEQDQVRKLIREKKYRDAHDIIFSVN